MLSLASRGQYVYVKTGYSWAISLLGYNQEFQQNSEGWYHRPSFFIRAYQKIQMIKIGLSMQFRPKLFHKNVFIRLKSMNDRTVVKN